MKKKRQKLLLILLLLVGIIGIGYAALSANLTINGTANVSATTWDVHFDNVQVTDGSATTTAPTIGTDTVSASFETTLNEPGDFYEFTIDVVNEGSIDAMIGDLDLDNLEADEEDYLDYSVTYSDGVSINEKDLLASGSTETVLIRIAFKDDIDADDLPTTGAKAEKEISITYVQADDTANEVDHSNMELDDTNSNGVADTGELITIGTERFYVISNDGTNVKALAEYNLEVGSNCIWSDSESSYTCTSISNPSGLQSSNALGYTSTGYNTTGNYGTVAFSSSTYWDSTDGATIDLTNSANIINPYLTAYKTSLTNLGGKISDVSLITKAELITLGCDASSYSCTGAPSWVYQTSYWSRSADTTYDVWDVGSNGLFSHDDYTLDLLLGVRPVITVLASDI